MKTDISASRRPQVAPGENVIIVAVIVQPEFHPIAPPQNVIALPPVFRALRNRLALEKLLRESDGDKGAWCGGTELNCSIYLFNVSTLQAALDATLDEVREMNYEAFAVIGWWDANEGIYRPWPNGTHGDLNSIVDLVTSAAALAVFKAGMRRLKDGLENS